MPSRKKKMNPGPSALKKTGTHGGKLEPVKVRGKRLSPARTHTRINAFITSMGRRNQAKRDAR